MNAFTFQKKIALALFLLVFSSFYASAVNSSISLYTYLPKTTFSSNESIELVGYLYNVTENNSVYNYTGISSANVTVNVSYSNGTLEKEVTFTTDSNGSFYTQSTYFPSATLLSAPSGAGAYNLSAKYEGTSSNYSSTQTITVNSTNLSVDWIALQPSKAEFLASETINVTATAFSGYGSSSVGVANYNISASLYNFSSGVIESSQCTTDSNGDCSLSFTAPSTSGSYYIAANNYLGYSYLRVVGFEVQATTKDESGVALKDIFSAGENAIAELQISYNGSTPSGNYTASLSIHSSNGSSMANLSALSLNSTNSYTSTANFSTTGYAEDSYYLNYTASDGTNTQSGRSWFQVRTAVLSLEKAESNSGFQRAYVSLPNSTLSFSLLSTYRANGSLITGLGSNFTLTLRTSLGYVISTLNNASYNSSCRSGGCYEFNVSAPGTTGEYTLVAEAALGGNTTLTAQRTITVSPLSVTSYPSESTGSAKAAFSTNEFVYIFFNAQNTTSAVNLSQAELSFVSFQNGTRINFTQGNWSSLNASSTNYTWAWNSTVRALKLVPPKQGGLYSVKAWVENKTTFASTQFMIRPYDVCTSAKASSDTNTNDYYWQFRTNDVLYLDIAVVQATNPVGTTINSSFNSTSGGGMYGYGSWYSCSIGNTQQAVANATVTINSVVNTMTGVAEPLNTTASVCQASSTDGKYLCTLKANDSAWASGKHVVDFTITGTDNQTTSKGTGFFETREFFIYGYTSNWLNKPNTTINLTVNAYEGGGSWWTNSQGLGGTITVQKVEYTGRPGEYSWPPATFNYNTSAVNSTTMTNGIGYVSLNASLAPNGEWTTGSYAATIKVTTEDGRTDYGQAWFEIRKWDAYGSPVEISGTSFVYKSSYGTSDTVQVYVRISNAGDYSSIDGQDIGGNVTISIKKLEQYTTWPPSEVNASIYNSTTTTVNASSPWYSSANTSSHLDYVVNITPTDKWPTGSYNALLDINGTETGWAWFSVKAFHADARAVDANNDWAYSYKPGDTVRFNVTTAKTPKWSGDYNASDLLNTTITGVKLSVWSETSYQYTELSNNTDFNLSQTTVNGTATINFTRGTSWPSGWYNGELIIENNESDKETAYIWFSVIPFNVNLNGQYTVGISSNATANITITDPISYGTALAGNYSVESVYLNSWSGYGNTRTNLSFTADATFNYTTNVTIQAPSSSWTSGWKSIVVTVKDNSDNSTREGWYSFDAKAFAVTITNARWQYTSNENVTVNVTLTDPGTGALTSGNITSIYESSWPTQTTYNFSVGSCNSATATGGCTINGSANVTIQSNGTWIEKYYYLYPKFTTTTDNTTTFEASSIYFNIVSPIQAYYQTGTMTTNNSNESITDGSFYYNYNLGLTDNVTLYIYNVRNLSESAVNVTVNSVEYSPESYSCWQESCRAYSEVNWTLITHRSDETLIAPSAEGLYNWGYIRVKPPSGTWTTGSNYLRVNVTSTSGVNASIKGIYLYIYG